ncbi:uncharacterized protein LOC111441439 isoform X2 [Cucurbita moschata]|uniref:Uncharacterized protein LOC111441439 isoform X2 n=1 Tax=Cucurbita moschata TaxID=3662 RepID=A0A6J1F208_CUCMO|nr:uncharacterized protein LOC111441439 isoform X2 [Cucurbita moschata]
MLIGTVIAPRYFFSRNKLKSSASSPSSSSPAVPLCSGRRPRDPRKDDDNDDQKRMASVISPQQIGTRLGRSSESEGKRRSSQISLQTNM